MTNPFADLSRRAIAIIAAAIVAVLAIWLIWHLWQKSSQAAGEARLATKQGEAALDSGRDAVESLGASQAKETAIDEITQENDRAIRSAPGADAPVDARVRDAGLAGLCKRAVYLRDPRCLQFTPSQRLAEGGERRTAAGGQ